MENHKDLYGFQLAVDPATFTIESLAQTLYTEGIDDFIPKFQERFPGVLPVFDQLEGVFRNASKEMLIKDIKIQNLDNVKR